MLTAEQRAECVRLAHRKPGWPHPPAQTERAFGPVFGSKADAEMFWEWLEATHGIDDARRVPSEELGTLHDAWIKSR